MRDMSTATPSRRCQDRVVWNRRMRIQSIYMLMLFYTFRKKSHSIRWNCIRNRLCCESKTVHCIFWSTNTWSSSAMPPPPFCRCTRLRTCVACGCRCSAVATWDYAPATACISRDRCQSPDHRWRCTETWSGAADLRTCITRPTKITIIDIASFVKVHAHR